MAAIVNNPTPKQRFQSDNKQVSAHRDMIGSKAFESGSDFAMMEYNRVLAMKVVDGNTATMAGIKAQGALEFLQTLRMLAETPPVQKPDPIPQNLKESN